MMDYEKVWITIPTYWGDYGTPENPPCIDFDHPTAPDGNETLSRTMESICGLPGDFSILVILAVTHKEYLETVRKRVRSILAPYQKRKRLYLAAQEEVDQINIIVNESRYSTLKQPFLKLGSCGNIRNVQLFVPYCLGAEYLVGIDDDEIIEDTDYLRKTVAFLTAEGGAGGLAGPYHDREGDYRIKGAEALEPLGNLFLKKNYFMNEAMKKSMRRSPEVHPNVIAFGGNMVFTRKTVGLVCHDPYIPRGEDYDYVINALMKGIRFYFHPEAGIVHLPPDSTGSQAGDNIRKLRADIRRFIYMSVKLEMHRHYFPNEYFDSNLLNPYPGAFAVESAELIKQGKIALKARYPDAMDERVVENFVDQAAAEAPGRVKEFFHYRELWERRLPLHADNRRVTEKLESMELQ